MKLISVECEKCGGRLNLPAGQKVIQCRICASTIFVEPQPSASSKQSFTPEQIAEFRLELEQLDYRWKKTCEQNQYSTMYTDAPRVAQGESVVLGILGPSIGIVWIAALDFLEISSYFLTGAGIAFILFSLHASATFSQNRTKQRDQFEEYSQRRTRLVSLIASAEEAPRKEESQPTRRRREQNPLLEEAPATGELSWSI